MEESKEEKGTPSDVSAEPPVDNTNGEGEEQVQYPHGPKLIALTIALMLSTLMVALDTNVIGKYLEIYLPPNSVYPNSN